MRKNKLESILRLLEKLNIEELKGIKKSVQEFIIDLQDRCPHKNQKSSAWFEGTSYTGRCVYSTTCLDCHKVLKKS